MILLVCLGIASGTFIYLSQDGGFDKACFGIPAIFVTLGFVAALIALPIARMNCSASMARYLEVKRMIDCGSQMNWEVSNKHQWLAEMKYWNNTILDIYVPDKVVRLSLLK